MNLGNVTPEMVLLLYPGTDVVPASDVQAASDWAEREMNGALPPATDTRQERELQRAVAAYSLYLASSRKADVYSTTSREAGLKRFKAEGDIEVEFFEQKNTADGVLLGASGWLARAEAALFAAGYGGYGSAFAGVIR